MALSMYTAMEACSTAAVAGKSCGPARSSIRRDRVWARDANIGNNDFLIGKSDPQRSGAIDTKYLTTDAELQGFVERAERAPWLALDTEFVRERTYSPQLCLLQCATPDELVLIDTLSLRKPELLRPLLESGPVKLVHSPGQDFEALATVGLDRLAPLFCTQTAHALLGGPPQIGYAGLVEQRLGVTLAKDQTRTDWSQRPLTEAQKGYAADDVRYLDALYQQLDDALVAAGRKSWMQQEMALLEQAYAWPDPTLQALKSRNLERLEGDEPCIYIALSVWREKRAQASDKPRSWIAKDGLLSALARRRPATIQALADIDGITPGLLRSQGKVLLEIIAKAAENCPDLPVPLDRNAVKAVQQALKAVADAQNLDPAVLYSRADCEQWLREKNGRLTQGWRQTLTASALSEVGGLA